MFQMLKDYKAPRNNLDDEPGLRESRFDVAAVIRPQLDALIEGQEQALSAEYYFLAGEHERVAALFKGRQLKKLTERERDTYGWSQMIFWAIARTQRRKSTMIVTFIGKPLSISPSRRKFRSQKLMPSTTGAMSCSTCLWKSGMAHRK